MFRNAIAYHLPSGWPWDAAGTVISGSDWRERIGNAVPPDAAQAIASEMGRTLLLAWSGETFTLSSAPIWVQPALAALTVAQGGAA